MNRARQHGVALVTALLVTALAVTLVSNLFWQQQVMVRAMEGQQLRLRARLLLRGDPADLRREIIDAQSRFNLRNLAPGASVDPFQLAAGPGLAVRGPEDLLAVPGVTPALLARLRPFATVLPEPTGVNVNRAPAEVLTSVANLTLEDAQALVARRRQAHFRDTGDFALRLNERETLEGVDFQVSSDYFLVSGRVTLERTSLDAQALVRRQGERGATLLWFRER